MLKGRHSVRYQVYKQRRKLNTGFLIVSRHEPGAGTATAGTRTGCERALLLTRHPEITQDTIYCRRLLQSPVFLSD